MQSKVCFRFALIYLLDPPVVGPTVPTMRLAAADWTLHFFHRRPGFVFARPGGISRQERRHLSPAHRSRGVERSQLIEQRNAIVPRYCRLNETPARVSWYGLKLSGS